MSDIDAEGRHTSRYGRTDQIGWRVPAVPTEDGESFWHYSLVPDPAVAWWKRIPTRPIA